MRLRLGLDMARAGLMGGILGAISGVMVSALGILFVFSDSTVLGRKFLARALVGTTTVMGGAAIGAWARMRPVLEEGLKELFPSQFNTDDEELYL